jgi:N-methylhydantoinase B
MAVSTEIFQEGLIIPPTLICERGRLREDILNLIQANVRTPQERRGDILAQIASCRRGEERLSELLKKMKPSVVSLNARGLLDYSEKMMRSSLSKIPLGSYEFEDCLDDDGISDKRLTIRVRVTVSRRGVVVDFSGTDAQTDGAVNCTLAVTLSAVYYCFLCLAGEMIPPNSGCFRPIRVIVPEGTLLNPRFPAAVAGGNVETSQRIVDVLFGALSKALPDKIPAASSGSMSNVGVGGIDPASGKPFTYYETIAGGSGASGGYDGESAVQTHMTNTLNTPIEVLEQSFPLQVLSYRIRAGSGGAGRFRGGDGIIREIKLLTDARISILSDRRKFAPYGLLGGASGRKGRNSLLLPDGRDFEELPSKTVVSARSGTVLRIETPGGGGFGTPCEQDIPTEQDWR